MEKDSIGNRMKANYEDRSRYKLTRRTPVILRLDGKAFHTVTKRCQKPFDICLRNHMVATARAVLCEAQGAKLAYIQSDEISILLTDFDTLTTDAWFDYNIQKIVSVSAAIASVEFSKQFKDTGIFDCRAFNIPKEEVCNYFVWRQQDWVRNSLAMLAQSQFSHKELQHKNSADMHEMLHTKNINWADLESHWKNGNILYRDSKGWINWVETSEIIFKDNRDIVERYLEGE
jgi:tRNA(His) 5'-end guanylyltransferase